MVASAFLPAMIRGGKLHFLFAKEANDDSAPGFSDFGGGVDPGEDIYDAGLREFAEESTGCFGDKADVKKMVEKYGKVLPFLHDTYNIHIFKMDYDPSVVSYFNNTHAFIHKHVRDTAFLRGTKIFEKVEMSWMTVPDMVRRRDEFRPFYREIVDKIVSRDELKRITAFISGINRTPQKSRKRAAPLRKTQTRTRTRTQRLSSKR
jgi:hypothetical protein